MVEILILVVFGSNDNSYTLWLNISILECASFFFFC